MEVSQNKVVYIHYKGTLKDGSVFDTSEGREPLAFIFGAGMIIPGLEEGIDGLKQGDKKTIEVPVEKAYGQRDPNAMQEVPREQLPPELDLKPGVQLAAQTPEGGVIPVVIAEVKDDIVVVDFNSPLAGEDLTFDIEIIEVREATPEELDHGHVH